MNKEALQLLQNLNEEYIPRYLGTSHEHEDVFEPSSSVPIWDKNQLTKYGLEYYDLMIANILVKQNQQVTCKLTANLAECITRLAYEGMRRLKIMEDYQARQMCESIALNKMPEHAFVYQYANYILRYECNALPCWFYYTLLLWGFAKTKVFNNTPLRSRYFTGLIHSYGLIKFISYESDRNLDQFSLKEKLIRLIKICTRDPRFEKDYDNYVAYLVDSFRVFSTITFAALFTRSCHWSKLKILGSEVITQRLQEHQKVVDVNYTNQSKGDYSEQTGSK